VFILELKVVPGIQLVIVPIRAANADSPERPVTASRQMNMIEKMDFGI
jgi:hypothetical protein